MLVTLQQAKKLATIGYPQDKLHQFKYNDVGRVIELGSAERMYNIGEEWNAPTIPEALEWFREVKGIPCSVNLYQDDSIKDCVYYVGCYKDGDLIRPIEMKLTHSDAESALLDEVMKYK